MNGSLVSSNSWSYNAENHPKHYRPEI